jgi:hypothetical protein
MVSGCEVLCSKTGGRTQNRRSHIALSPKTENNREHGDDNQTRGQRTFRGRKTFCLNFKTSPEITIPATTRNY